MAERIIANLTLDTYQRNKIPPLVIPQHDYGARYIRVRITEQGENVSVASGSVVSIIAKRMADGQSAAFSGSVNADGSVLVPVTQWMLDAPSDDVDCHVAVTGTGYQYSTTSFVISPQERENPSYLEEDDPRVNIVEEALIKVVEEADRAEEQANLAASNAKAEVEKLVGELGVVQETGVSITSVMSQGASSRSFANAIKGEESGGAVLCEEVSPVLHPVVVGVRSKNLVSTNSASLQGAGYVFINKFSTPLEQGAYTVSFKASGYEDNSEFSMGFERSNGREFAGRGTKLSGISSLTLVANEKIYGVYVFSNSTTGLEATEIMLNPGETAEPYTPNVPNGTAVKVTSVGANLFKAELGGDGYILNGTGEGLEVVDANTISYIPKTGGGADYIRLAQKYRHGNYIVSNKCNSPRQMFWLFDAFGNNISSQYSSNFDATYNEYYDGFYYDGENLNITVPNDVSFWRYGVFFQFNNNNRVTVSEIQVSLGMDTPYEPYKAGQTIDTTVGSTIDLPSIAPYMSVYTNTEGTAVDVTYVKDTNAVVQKLVNAIVALGGNV